MQSEEKTAKGMSMGVPTCAPAHDPEKDAEIARLRAALAQRDAELQQARTIRRRRVPVCDRIAADLKRMAATFIEENERMRKEGVPMTTVYEHDENGERVYEERMLRNGKHMDKARRVKRLGRRDWACAAAGLVGKLAVLTHTAKERDEVKLARYQKQAVELGLLKASHTVKI